MSLLKMLGKKQIEIASNWYMKKIFIGYVLHNLWNFRRITSGATFGTAAGLGLLYFTDWRVFVGFIPFYNTKFADESSES